ncbi:hypothetical protein GF360_00100 [candidate division WWE3 bacterium]|nr:hypothetical protein [candidate division WWE3 bacterium]
MSDVLEGLKNEHGVEEILAVDPSSDSASGSGESNDADKTAGNSPGISVGKLRKVLGNEEDVVLKIGLLADSEGDWENLEKAVKGLEDLGVETAFFLGDLTQYGSIEDLQKGRQILESSDIKFLVLPGDHDLAQSVTRGDLSGRSGFIEVFGNVNQVHESEGHKFLLLDNSANYTKVSKEDLTWFSTEIKDTDFVILSQPLYHPTNPRVMGKVDGDVVSTVRLQAEEILKTIQESNAQAIIAADQHFFSINKDPVRESLAHIVIGALISNKNSLRNPQSSRYAILKIYASGYYDVTEVVL